MLLTLISVISLSLTYPVCGQVLVNGQVFTNGLAIIDSPAPASTLHAGSATGIAIDVSGDGHLTADALNPESHLSSHFSSLEIYLTSPNLNLTVSQGPGLLQQETGSTVKHINWSIDNCVPSGDYNLTFYEGSQVQDKAWFTITHLPIAIQNTNSSSSCSNNSNSVQAAPQKSSSLARSPWLDETQTSLIPFPSPTASSASSLHVLNSVLEVVALGVAAIYFTFWV